MEKKYKYFGWKWDTEYLILRDEWGHEVKVRKSYISTLERILTRIKQKYFIAGLRVWRKKDK